METNHNGGNNPNDYNATGKHRDYREGTEETDSEINEASGINKSEEETEDRKFHEEHGNRKYKMFRNHSSADDQPATNTGPGL